MGFLPKNNFGFWVLVTYEFITTVTYAIFVEVIKSYYGGKENSSFKDSDILTQNTIYRTEMFWFFALTLCLVLGWITFNTGSFGIRDFMILHFKAAVVEILIAFIAFYGLRLSTNVVMRKNSMNLPDQGIAQKLLENLTPPPNYLMTAVGVLFAKINISICFIIFFLGLAVVDICLEILTGNTFLRRFY